MKTASVSHLSAFFLALILPASSALAAQVTLTGDAHVTAARSTTNFGTLANLYVGNGNTALLQFDLSSLPSGTIAAQISHASLTLFLNRVNTSGPVSLAAVTSTWSEAGVTYATIPTIGVPIGSFTALQAGQYITIDVTALVQGWIAAPSTNFGFALSSSSANVLFDSKENDETGHAATLDIALTGQQGPTGAAGTPGAIGPQGLQGVQGLIGPQGPSGIPGPIGLTGATGASGTGVTYRGTYSAATTYAANDAVTFNGSSYISLQGNNTGNPPSSSPAFFAVFAVAGAPGAAGATGMQGPQGVPGSPGTQGPIGPIGITGPTGATGATGATGTGVIYLGAYSPATTYAANDAVTFNGSSYISLQNNNTGNPPDISPAFFAVFAAAGAPGVAGATGVQGPQGVPGITGPQGVPGGTGPIGPIGATGATGATGAGFIYRGAYSPATTYAANDVITFNGSSYLSLQDNNTNNTPSSSPAFFVIVAAAGSPGVAGATGATGPQGPIGPQGNTGANGVAGPAGATGTAGATGATGAAGATGPAGPAGVNFIGAYSPATSYHQNDVVTFNSALYIDIFAGTITNIVPTNITDWSVLLPQGATGATGPAGAAGPTGSQGPTGATGAQGPAGTSGGGGITYIASVINYTDNGIYFVSPIANSGIDNSNGDQTSVIGNNNSLNGVVVPFACTVTYLKIGANNYEVPGADTNTITVVHNSVATSMGCAVTTNGNSSSCSDVTHTFTVNAGDTISLRFTQTNFTPDVAITTALNCQ